METRRAFVGSVRADGKYPVQLVYPLSGKRIQKILPRERVEALASNGYLVIGFQTRGSWPVAAREAEAK